MTDSKKLEFLNHLRTSLEAGSFVRLVVSKYRGPEDLERLLVVPVIIQNTLYLSFRYHYSKHDVTKNFPSSAALQLLERLLGAEFLSATLFTCESDLTLQYSRKRVPQLSSRKPTFSDGRVAPHNREKQRFIDSHADWLRRLGLTDSRGQIKRMHYDKYRQIDKFVEIIDALMRESPLAKTSHMSVVDFGSGKSYLTFALFDYLSNQRGFQITMRGIELRPELVALSNTIAQECRFTGLTFQTGAIFDFPTTPIDLVVALHACDTATDDAILKALQAEAELIVVAPCCHKYLRPRMTIPESMHPLFKHGIQRERLSTLLTDSLRALTLEKCGYRTKVFEFISSEHTDKNTMITAIRQDTGGGEEMRIEAQIRSAMRLFSLDDFYLDKLIASASDPGCA